MFLVWVFCSDTRSNKRCVFLSCIKTPVWNASVVWPTKFPRGPHLLSVVHGLLEGLPTSQHLISHTSTSYTCVKNAQSLPLFPKGLKAISLLWLDENASLKYTLNSASLILFTRPGDILKWRKFNFLVSSNRVEQLAGRKIFYFPSLQISFCSLGPVSWQMQNQHAYILAPI